MFVLFEFASAVQPELALHGCVLRISEVSDPTAQDNLHNLGGGSGAGGKTMEV